MVGELRLFDKFVRDNLRDDQPVAAVIASFTEVASIWNREVFSSIGMWKRRIMARLTGI